MYAPRCRSLTWGTPLRWEWRSLDTASGMCSLCPASSHSSGPPVPAEVRLEAVWVGWGAPGRGSVGVVGQGHAGVVGVPRVRVGLEGGCYMVVVAAGMCAGLHLFIAVSTATPWRRAITAMPRAAAAGRGPVRAAWAVPSLGLWVRFSFRL